MDGTASGASAWTKVMPQTAVTAMSASNATARV
jgi:hypothetical protein